MKKPKTRIREHTPNFILTPEANLRAGNDTEMLKRDGDIIEACIRSVTKGIS